MMSTKSRTYAGRISDAQVMLSGLKANGARLEKRGITGEFVTGLETALNNIVAKNNEQEKLKADLKTATAALDALMAQMLKSVSEAATLVKMEIPKEQWKEFGITAKR